MRINSAGTVDVQHDAYDGMQRSLTLSNPRNAAGSGDGTSIYFNNTGTSTIARSAYIGGVSETNYGQSNALVFGTSSGGSAPTEAVRIDSSGNLLVGTTDTTPYDNSANSTADNGIVAGAGLFAAARYQGSVGLFNRTGNDGEILGFKRSGANVGSIGSRGGVVSHIILDPRSGGAGLTAAGASLFPTNNAGAVSDAAIDLGYSVGGTNYRFKDLWLSGDVFVGATSQINSSKTSILGTATTNVLGLKTEHSNYLISGYSSTTEVFRVASSGNVTNANNSYGSLSDERLKSNIVDASSQLDDIMAVQVRSYTLDSTGETHIGVVAQELEASGMSGLVEEDKEGIKSVKYSVLYMKAIKAIQEQQATIEALTARIAALES
jgi:hypothetical protein